MPVDETAQPHKRHRAAGPSVLRAAVLTVSDTRTAETDVSGKLMADMLTEAGHRLVERQVLPDEPELLVERLRELSGRSDLDLILLNGGTGIAPRDRTIEAVAGVLGRQLPGFGELFRALSYREIGAAAMTSRALAGVLGDKLVFSTPGSPGAVRLAMRELILPEASHLVGQIRSGAPPARRPGRRRSG
jgi:molybdenum cofactor biosynthesis protein B